MVSKTKKGSNSGMGVMKTIPDSAAYKKRAWAYDNYGPTISGGSRIDSMVTEKAQARISKVNKQADKKFGFTHEEYGDQTIAEQKRKAGVYRKNKIKSEVSRVPRLASTSLSKAKAGKKDLVTKSK